MARIVEEGMFLGFFVQWAISSQLERSRLEHRPRARGEVAPRGWRAQGRCGWGTGSGRGQGWREKVARKSGVEISGVEKVKLVA